MDEGARDAAQLATDIREEGQRLSTATLSQGLPIRLMGGVAVWLTSPSARTGGYAREYRDLDFAASGRKRSATTFFFEAHGYQPDRRFNALHGAQRLNFLAPDGRWPVDVIFDELNMAHRIDLRGRLELAGPTLDLADLLLTKLQVFELNEKDLGDIVCLLADHPIGEVGAERIDVARILSVASGSWGLAHTVQRNLRRAAEQWRVEPIAGSAFEAGTQAEALIAAIEKAPKSLRWRARARIGERLRWYQTPEELPR